MVCLLRLSSLPFVSKTFNVNFIEVATKVRSAPCRGLVVWRGSKRAHEARKYLTVCIHTVRQVMTGFPVKAGSINLFDLDYVCIKAPMFSFTRLQGADPTLGVEMASTGEVCLHFDGVEITLDQLIHDYPAILSGCLLRT